MNLELVNLRDGDFVHCVDSKGGMVKGVVHRLMSSGCFTVVCPGSEAKVFVDPTLWETIDIDVDMSASLKALANYGIPIVKNVESVIDTKKPVPRSYSKGTILKATDRKGNVLRGVVHKPFYPELHVTLFLKVPEFGRVTRLHAPYWTFEKFGSR